MRCPQCHRTGGYITTFHPQHPFTEKVWCLGCGYSHKDSDVFNAEMQDEFATFKKGRHEEVEGLVRRLGDIFREGDLLVFIDAGKGIVRFDEAIWKSMEKSLLEAKPSWGWWRMYERERSK